MFQNQIKLFTIKQLLFECWPSPSNCSQQWKFKIVWLGKDLRTHGPSILEKSSGTHQKKKGQSLETCVIKTRELGYNLKQEYSRKITKK